MEEFLSPDPRVHIFLDRYSKDDIDHLSVSSGIELPEKIKHPEKVIQFRLSREMGRALLPGGLCFHPNGKPFSPGLAGVSISHTYGIVGIMYSQEFDCGLDIEVLTERALRLSKRFCTRREKDLVETYFSPEHGATLVWSFKEACYKLYGIGGLEFSQDIQLTGVHVENSSLSGYLRTKAGFGMNVSGFFCFFEGRVLVYVIPHLA